MTQIKVEMTFNSVEALLQYFCPTQDTVPTAPIALMPNTTAAAATIPNLPNSPPQQEQDIASAVRGALDAMLQRLPSGTGAAKAHEILNKYGYKRTRDVADPVKAQSIIAEFKAA